MWLNEGFPGAKPELKQMESLSGFCHLFCTCHGEELKGEPAWQLGCAPVVASEEDGLLRALRLSPPLGSVGLSGQEPPPFLPRWPAVTEALA